MSRVSAISASAVRGMLTRPGASIGAIIVLFWTLIALLAPVLPLQSPTAMDVMAMASPEPSADHWLGVDAKGRDMLARIVWGAGYVFIIAPAALLGAYATGIAIGASAAYFGGIVDLVLSRLTETIMAFPTILLYILLITTVGPSLVNILFAITLSTVPPVSRIVRGMVLELKSKPYVAAAKLRGENPLYIMVVEILPNTTGPLLTDACLRFGWIVVSIGSLGFLGLGLPPPTPEWGGMIREGIGLIMVWPHMALIPCVAIVSLVLAFNLLADSFSAE